MASKSLNKCCVTTHLHEGTPVGKHNVLYGLDTYQTGIENGNERIIIIATDVFGYKYNNNMLIADELARAGYHVLIPDMFNGEPLTDFSALEAWKQKHSPEIIWPFLSRYIEELKSDLKPKFLGAIGHCYGAKFSILGATENGYFDAIAVAHPSLVDIEEVKAIAVPILISAAETDPVFGPELRHETEIELSKLSKSKGLRYQIDLFSGVSHGYAVRGDLSNPQVTYAKEKTLSDQICFFSQF